MIRGSIRFSQSVVCKEGIRNISPYENLYDVEVEFGCGDVEVEWRSTPKWQPPPQRCETTNAFARLNSSYQVVGELKINACLVGQEEYVIIAQDARA